MTDSTTGLSGKQRLALWGGAAALMLLPLIAMRFTREVDWGRGDFMFLGLLLLGLGGTYELAARTSGHRAYRTAAAVALVAASILIWLNLAVGIIGDEGNPANLMYGGVLAVAALGSVVAGGEPAGMDRVMMATAIAQAVVFVVALVAGFGFTGPITVFFGGLWLTSAWLFRKAAREHASRASMP